MGKPYILCVDDDITILLSLKAQLKYCLGSKFQYEIAEGVSEAWELIDEIASNGDELAVVISDWLMPETKGDEFLISVHQKFPDTVTVMLTGHAEAEAVARAKGQAGLKGIFTKPWNKDALVELILRYTEER